MTIDHAALAVSLVFTIGCSGSSGSSTQASIGNAGPCSPGASFEGAYCGPGGLYHAEGGVNGPRTWAAGDPICSCSATCVSLTDPTGSAAVSCRDAGAD